MSSIQNINFDIFNLYDLSPPFNMGIIGLSGTGRKWLIRELLNFFNKRRLFSNYVIISPREKYHGFFRYITEGKIYDKLTPDLMTEIIKFQNTSDNVNEIKPLLVIMLDQNNIHRTRIHQDKSIMKEFYSKLYSLNISTIVTQLFPTHDFIRFGYKYNHVFFSKIDFCVNMKRAHDIFLKHSMNYPLFERIHDYLTKGFTFMVVKDLQIHRPIKEYIYHYLVSDKNNDFTIKLLDLDNPPKEILQNESKEIKIIKETDSEDLSHSENSDDTIEINTKPKVEPFDINKFVKNSKDNKEINKLQMMENILNMNKEILDYIIKN